MRGGGWFSNPAPASAPASEPVDAEVENLKMKVETLRRAAESTATSIVDLKSTIEQQQRQLEYTKNPLQRGRIEKFLNEEAPNLLEKAEAQHAEAQANVEAAQKKYDDYLAQAQVRDVQKSRTNSAPRSTVRSVLPPVKGGRGRRRKSRRSRTQ